MICTWLCCTFEGYVFTMRACVRLLMFSSVGESNIITPVSLTLLTSPTQSFCVMPLLRLVQKLALVVNAMRFRFSTFPCHVTSALVPVSPC